MNRFILTLIFLVFFVNLFAQNNAEIRGRVFDANLSALEKATVSLVSTSDSMVLTYGLTNDKGEFDLVRLPTGKPLLLYISHVNSSPFEKNILLKAGEKLNLDSIKMKANTIEEVLITAVAPIRMNGDTLEFKADYFKTRPNASVEELLKLLPGLQVNVDGSIFYQGREVSGVRVNNKDFFAQDLKIATRNLDAALIDVVQVIKDKGESKREITDESELPIVINLKMKKEFLKADFGKFYGGAATRDRYESGALMNAFRDTLQVSFIGFANNINRQGFDYAELSQYGGYGRAENNNMVMYGSRGLINQMSTGVNINYDIAKKLKTNLMYNFKRNNNYNRSENDGKSFYNDIQEESSSSYNNESADNNHEIRAFARYHIDTTAQISYDGRLNSRANNNMNDGFSENWRDTTIPVTKGNFESSSKGGSMNYNHNLYGEKKFKNKWLLSLRQNLNNTDNNSNRSNASVTRYYLQNDSVFDEQRRTNSNGVNFSLNHRLNLQIPLHKKINIDLYAHQDLFDEKSIERILNKVNADEFTNRNDAANNRRIKSQQYTGGTRWNIKPIKDVTLILGMQWLNLHNKFMYYQKLPDKSNQHHYWLADASLGYKNLNLSYNSSIQRPSFYQIVAVDSDLSPNYITYASPYFENVKEERINLRYNKYFTKSKMNFSFNAGVSWKDKDVAHDQTYNPQTSFGTGYSYQTAGVKNYNFSGYFSKNFLQSKVWNLSYNLRLYAFTYQNYSRINGEENLGSSMAGDITNTINLSYKDLITFSPSYGYNLNQTTYKYASENFRGVNNDRHNLGATLHFHNLKKFKLETSYTLRNQVMNINSGRENLHIVNASLYYPVFGKGELKLSVFDLLNQNVSNYFYTHGNSTGYSSNLNLRQYFMLGLVYKFLNTGKK